MLLPPPQRGGLSLEIKHIFIYGIHKIYQSIIHLDTMICGLACQVDHTIDAKHHNPGQWIMQPVILRG